MRGSLGSWQGCGIAEGLATLSGAETTGCPHTCTGGSVDQQEQAKANSSRTRKASSYCNVSLSPSTDKA